MGLKSNYQKNVISKGRIRLVCSACGISIFWDNKAITQGAGLNVAINTLGLWTDSVKADWQILENKEDSLKAKVVFRDLPMSQVWSIRIDDEKQIDWQIDMDVEEWLHIDEYRILGLVNPRYKSWVNNYKQADFPRLDSQWHDLCLDNLPAHLVGARFPLEGDPLPSFILEEESRSFFPLIQNLPLNDNAHIIGFRHIDSEEKKDYSSGQYCLFTGKINLFENDYLLDTKIEDLRQSHLDAAIKEKVPHKKLKRKLRILIVNLPWQKDGRWGVRAGSRWPHIRNEDEGDYLPFPFFMAYAASLLQKYSFDVSIIDAVAEQIPEDKFLEKILGMNFDYFLTETSIPSFYDDLSTLKKISSRGIPIILCGPNSEIYQTKFLIEYPFINFVLFGEYEFTLLDLMQRLQKEEDLSKVKGLIYKDNGKIIRNHKREPFDVNLLPWPYRDTLPINKYLDAPGEMSTPSVQMVASRGCPFKCQFCLWPQVIYQGHLYRPRNVKDVVDEMEFLVRRKGFKSVYFDDDTFNIGKERMLDFCREVKKRRLNDTQWAVMARPDLMDEQILKNMKEAGLWAVKYGVESATQSLVNCIGKNMDLRKSEKMISLTKELGIKVHLTFTFGLPGETRETIENTIRYALKLSPFSVQFSITTPFPGTEYYKILEKQGLIISKNLSYYDGHLKSVIKLENLAPRDLEMAKMKAYRVWADYLRKRRGFLGSIKRFCDYLNNKGLIYAIYKTISYFQYILFKRKKYLGLRENLYKNEF